MPNFKKNYWSDSKQHRFQLGGRTLRWTSMNCMKNESLGIYQIHLRVPLSPKKSVIQYSLSSRADRLIRDRWKISNKISNLKTSNIKPINYLVFPLKSSLKRKFSVNFRGSRCLLIHLNSFYVRNEFCERSLRWEGTASTLEFCNTLSDLSDNSIRIFSLLVCFFIKL